MFCCRAPDFIALTKPMEKEITPGLFDAAELFYEKLPFNLGVKDLIQLLLCFINDHVKARTHQLVVYDEISQSYWRFLPLSTPFQSENPDSLVPASIVSEKSAISRYFTNHCSSIPYKPIQNLPAYHENAIEVGDDTSNKESDVVFEMKESMLEIVVPFYFRQRLTGWLGLTSKTDQKEYSIADIRLTCDLLKIFALFLERAFNDERKTLLGHIPRGIAHDMRNWLAPISSCIQLQAERETKSLIPIKKLLPLALQGIGLWSYYLSHSTQCIHKTKNWKLIRMDALVLRTITCFKVGDKYAPLILEHPISAYVYGDEVLLFRLFGNFISNALRLSPDSREIILSMKLIPKQENGYQKVGIYVADKGPGIIPELLSSFYQPTFAALGEQGNSAQEGLGLAICRQIAHLHGGALTLEKNEGGGTYIGVELPCSDAVSILNPKSDIDN